VKIPGGGGGVGDRSIVRPTIRKKQTADDRRESSASSASSFEGGGGKVVCKKGECALSGPCPGEKESNLSCTSRKNPMAGFRKEEAKM